MDIFIAEVIIPSGISFLIGFILSKMTQLMIVVATDCKRISEIQCEILIWLVGSFVTSMICLYNIFLYVEFVRVYVFHLNTIGW